MKRTFILEIDSREEFKMTLEDIIEILPQNIDIKGFKFEEKVIK